MCVCVYMCIFGRAFVVGSCLWVCLGAGFWDWSIERFCRDIYVLCGFRRLER